LSDKVNGDIEVDEIEDFTESPAELLEEIEEEDPAIKELLKDDPALEGALLNNPKKLKALIKLTRTEIRASNFPPADEMIKIESVYPGFIESYVKSNKQEQSNRMALAKKGMNFTLTERIIGQVFAFIIVMTCILGGLYATFNGYEKFGATLIGINLLGLATAFIVGRWQSKKRNTENPEE
jgi:uncharacterized membrane protein